MKRIYLILFFAFFLWLPSCAHTPDRDALHDQSSKLSDVEKDHLYAILANEIKTQNARHLKECNCMEALHRDLFAKRSDTSRYVLDEKVGEHAASLATRKKTVNVLALGSGTLLNELTAAANILARGINLNIYLNDWAYIFYGDKDFAKTALAFAQNPATIPEPWRHFYFWQWPQDKEREKDFLPFFEKHHRSIDEFKSIIKALDKIYGTKTNVTVLKPAKKFPLKLPPIDVILTIDAFQDLPNLLWQLHYQTKLTTNPVRFISLNKNKIHGGFWESKDKGEREANSQQPVMLEIYDVISGDDSGAYTFIERRIFHATDWQLKNALDFNKNPDADSQQSPLDDK